MFVAVTGLESQFSGRPTAHPELKSPDANGLGGVRIHASTQPPRS